jgi:release factor glutamine methyltransferase
VASGERQKASGKPDPIQDAGSAFQDLNSRRLLDDGIARLTASHIEEPRLDAELLLADVLQTTRSHLVAHLDETPPADAAKRYLSQIARRARHEPIAYILGRKEFFGLDLFIDARVLIPRPETELLVEHALAWLDGHQQTAKDKRLSVVDVGTGSGAIILALAARSPLPLSCVSLLATDRSLDALAVARVNAKRMGLSDRIDFRHADLLGSLSGPFDLIVANLPYITHEEWRDLAPDISQYEPAEALDGGMDGLDPYRALLAQANGRLASGGALMLEIGSTQGISAQALAEEAFPRAKVAVIKDLAALDRLVVIST